MTRKLKMILLTMYVIIAGLFLVGISCDKAQAEDLVKPTVRKGEQVLSEHYSPNGGALLFFDYTGDGVCDAASIFGFLKADEKMVYIKSLTCSAGRELLAIASDAWKRAGFIPMIYDKDKGELVPYKEK